MRALCSYVVSTLMLAAVAHAQPVQWKLSDGGNGHWYEAVAAPGISWDEAAANADSVGGYLCTVPTEAENLWVFENISSDPSLWNQWYGPFIGGYQDLEADDYSEPAGGWRWVTGEQWDYTAWTPNDPSDNGGQDHLAYAGENGNPIQPRWNDLEHPQPGGYVIEWDHLPAIQWRIEDGGCGHWYQLVRQPDGMSWTDAQARAIDMGGYLATIVSAAEDDFIFNNLTSDASAWSFYGSAPLTGHGPALGGSRLDVTDPESPFAWETVEEWGYENWAAGQPDGTDSNNNVEPYVHLYSVGTGLPMQEWNDIRDYYDIAPIVAFVVEWSADCNGDGAVDYGQILNGTLEDENGDGLADICQPSACAGDTDGNGIVDIEDLLNVIGMWGLCP